jgi:hypothetical protein
MTWQRRGPSLRNVEIDMPPDRIEIQLSAHDCRCWEEPAQHITRSRSIFAACHQRQRRRADEADQANAQVDWQHRQFDERWRSQVEG